MTDLPIHVPEGHGNTPPSWAELLGRVADGDSLALATLYDHSSTIIYSIARRILTNSADAEEITVDVYTYVWRSARTYNPARGSAATWLIMLARSRALDRLRKIRDRNSGTGNPSGAVERLASETADCGNHSLPECDRRVFMNAAIMQLPADDRQLIELAFFAGLSHTEMASQLNVPLGTVKTRIRTALLRLRDLSR